MTRPAILVVGGYGAVGQELCRDLARHGLLPVVAGRSPEKGAALAQRLSTSSRRLDVDEPPTWPAALAGIGMVVMCVDQTSTGFVRYLFDRGIHYVDLTATDGFFRALEALPPPDRSAALLSVGLAPGLTNMLAAAIAAAFDRPTRVDIGLLFGLGDSHGSAGLDWMAARIFDPARPRSPRRIDFGRPWGLRTAHVVDFSDQHALTRRMPSAVVTTRVAFDSRLATAVLFGISTWLGRSAVFRRLVRRSFSAVRLGSKAVNVTVEARGLRGGILHRATVRYRGEDESRTTARVASLMIRLFLAGRPPHGIQHSHDAFDCQHFLAALRAEGIGELEWNEASPAPTWVTPEVAG